MSILLGPTLLGAAMNGGRKPGWRRGKPPPAGALAGGVHAILDGGSRAGNDARGASGEQVTGVVR
jgi:hypothetical protein